MKGIKKYFRELLEVLKSIDKSLARLASCVEDAPKHGQGYVIKTSHWND